MTKHQNTDFLTSGLNQENHHPNIFQINCLKIQLTSEVIKQSIQYFKINFSF